MNMASMSPFGHIVVPVLALAALAEAGCLRRIGPAPASEDAWEAVLSDIAATDPGLDFEGQWCRIPEPPPVSAHMFQRVPLVMVLPGAEVTAQHRTWLLRMARAGLIGDWCTAASPGQCPGNGMKAMLSLSQPVALGRHVVLKAVSIAVDLPGGWRDSARTTVFVLAEEHGKWVAHHTPTPSHGALWSCQGYTGRPTYNPRAYWDAR